MKRLRHERMSRDLSSLLHLIAEPILRPEQVVTSKEIPQNFRRVLRIHSFSPANKKAMLHVAQPETRQLFTMMKMKDDKWRIIHVVRVMKEIEYHAK